MTAIRARASGGGCAAADYLGVPCAWYGAVPAVKTAAHR